MLAVVAAGFGHAVVKASAEGGAGTARGRGAVVVGASHPAVAVWFALGAAGLAVAVVVMAWSVNARQIRLAELLARRQFLVIAETGAAGHALDEGADPEITRPEIEDHG